MQLTIVLPIAFCALISAAPLQKRDAAAVLSDISAISSDVATLIGEISSYTGSSDQSTSLVSDVECLDSSLKTATSDTTSSAAFSETDSESIANAISALTSNVITLLTDLDAKSSVVASAGYTSVVESGLQTLMTDSDNLLTAVTDKVTESQTSAIGTSADEINYAFNVALSTY